MGFVSLSTQFLDELRARTTLSALIQGSVKLVRAGREWKGCCPFHNEKTASFYVNDDKGFYHCFGCSAHGDAIRWLTDHGGLEFMDAVRELAGAAGLEVPAASPEYARREAAIEDARQVLEVAAEWYGARLAAEPRAQAILADRGVEPATVERFGLGLAPAHASVTGCGAAFDALKAAGLLVETQNGWLDRFRQRIMIPIHDHRGRVIGFGGRAISAKAEAKYLNSAEGPHFDKGRTLFNLHRAAPAARSARRLVIVEGYFDVIALDQVGIAEAVAPMGTALTPEQLERAWRVDPCPVLLLDGDSAGRRAAMKACERALPKAGPGASMRIATLPDGQDPDDLARAGGREAIDWVIGEAVPMATFVFDALVIAAGDTPEARAALWKQLDELARSIVDDETRAQYLATWRARYDREVSAVAEIDDERPSLHALIEADEGNYAWPEETTESERRLVMIVRHLLKLRADRREVNESIKDGLAVAKAAGFDKKAINALILDLEADASVREEHEAVWALYRRVMGVKGPMSEAMMPSPIDARAVKVTTAIERRLSKVMIMIEARDGPALLEDRSGGRMASALPSAGGRDDG